MVLVFFTGGRYFLEEDYNQILTPTAPGSERLSSIGSRHRQETKLDRLIS